MVMLVKHCPGALLVGPAVHRAIGVVLNRGMQLDSPLDAMSPREMAECGSTEDCGMENSKAVSRAVGFLFNAMRQDMMLKIFVSSITSVYHRKALSSQSQFSRSDAQGVLNQLSERQRYLLGHLVEMLRVLHNNSSGRLSFDVVAKAMTDNLLAERDANFRNFFTGAFFRFFVTLFRLEFTLVPQSWRQCSLCIYQTKLFEVTLPTLKMRTGSALPLLMHQLIEYLSDSGNLSQLAKRNWDNASIGYVALRRQVTIDSSKSSLKDFLTPSVAMQLLMDFLKRLPEPLLPLELMVKCFSARQYMVDENSVRDLLEKLPSMCKQVLAHLLPLMRCMSEFDTNELNITSVAEKFIGCFTQNRLSGLSEETARTFMGGLKPGVGVQLVLHLMRDSGLLRRYRQCRFCEPGKKDAM